MPTPARPRRAVATALLAGLATGLATLVVVAAPPSSAAPPGNDHLANALEVGLAAGSSTSLPLTTAEATRETGEPTPCGSIKNTVWVAYTPINTQLLTAQTDATTNQMDTVLAAHTAATPDAYPLASVACNDDTTPIGRRSRITFLATAGTTYYLQVGHYGGSPQSGDPGPGPLQLSLSAAAANPNDDASTPTELGDPPGSVSVDTTNATHSASDPSRPNATYRSLWYSFEASVTGRIVFDAAGSSATSPDTLLYAFPGSGPTTLADALEYNDDLDEDNDDYRSRIAIDVVFGQTYRVLAGTRGDHGVFTLSWQLVGTPIRAVNDDFANATVLAASGSLSRADEELQRASSEPRDPDLTGTSGGSSLWYRWTAPADGVYEFATSSAVEPPDTVLAVFASTDFNALGQPVAFNDDADGTTVGSRVVFEADAGTTYSVLVDGWPTRFRGPFTLTWGAFTPASTTTVLTANSPTPGVVDLAVTVKEADNDPGTGTVAIRDGATEVAEIGLSGGTASGRLRGQTGGTHSYTAVFVPDTLLQAPSTSAAVPVPVTARPRPANDDFANAAMITGDEGETAADLLAATAEEDDPSLENGLDGATVWYRWVAPVSDSYTFTAASTEPGADLIIATLRGQALRDVTAIASSADPAGAGAAITFPAIAGRTYYLLLDAFTAGTATLTWSRGAATQPTTTVLSTDTSGGDYAITLQSTSTLTPGGGPAGDGLVAFFRGAVALGIAEATAGVATLPLTFQRPGNSAFTAEFYPASATVRPSGSDAQPATVQAPDAPDHDVFATALNISTLNGVTGVTGTSYGATPDPGTPTSELDSHADTTVWYRWVAPANGSYEFTATRSQTGVDTVLRAFEGSTLATLRLLGENDDGTGIANSITGISAVKGRTYHLAVDAYSLSRMGPFTLTWATFTPPQTTTTALAGAASGRTVRLTATVADPAPGSPAGIVQFFEGTASRGQMPVTTANGRVTRTLTNVTPGAHRYRAVFVPNDYRVRQSTSPIRTVTVPKSASRTTLTAPARTGAGSRPTVTAAVKVGGANAAGRVRFSLNGRVLRTVALRRGRASLQLPSLRAGTSRVVATYLGTAQVRTSSATRSIVVRP